jgi:hypothetical protein
MGNTRSHTVNVIDNSITVPSEVVHLDSTFLEWSKGGSVRIPLMQMNVALFDVHNVEEYDNFLEDCIYRRLQVVCSTHKITVPTAKEMRDFDWKSFKRSRSSNSDQSSSKDPSSSQIPSEKDSEEMPPLEEESEVKKGEETIARPQGVDEKANAHSNENDEKRNEPEIESDDPNDDTKEIEKWIAHGFIIKKCLFPTQLDKSLRIFEDTVRNLMRGAEILREQDAFRWRIKKEKRSESSCSSSWPNYGVLLFLKSRVPFCKACGIHHHP